MKWGKLSCMKQPVRTLFPNSFFSLHLKAEIFYGTGSFFTQLRTKPPPPHFELTSQASEHLFFPLLFVRFRMYHVCIRTHKNVIQCQPFEIIFILSSYASWRIFES